MHADAANEVAALILTGREPTEPVRDRGGQ
jgi:hypothetical protein